MSPQGKRIPERADFPSLTPKGRTGLLRQSSVHKMLFGNCVKPGEGKYIEHLHSPENADFTLNPDSPVFKLGFRPIDVNAIGLKQK
jgi:hypothetical protein